MLFVLLQQNLRLVTVIELVMCKIIYRKNTDNAARKERKTFGTARYFKDEFIRWGVGECSTSDKEA